jgi:dihydroorotase
MADFFDLIIKDGTVLTPKGAVQTDIGIAGERIAALGDLARHRAGDVFEAKGLHVLPGVIDTQVHFREPGLEHKENLDTGGRSAVLGGVTAVFEMPNTNPPTTSIERLADKVARARGRMFCDFAFFAGGTAENVADIPALEAKEGCAGIKVFLGSSTGSLLVEKREVLRAILGQISRRASFHCEDEARLRERKPLAQAGRPETHPIWRDEQAALLATQMLVEEARLAGKPVHVLHVTTAEEMAYLRGNKDIASVEVTPHHLTLVAPDAYERLGTLAQMNPPVREARHREALWDAIADGTVDVLGSDHAPHTLEEKAREYPASPSGMTGVQTLVPIMLDHVSKGRLSLERFAELSSANPARLFRAKDRGRIAEGMTASLTIADLKARREIRNEAMASRSGWTPYHGVEVTGWPMATLVRGRVVMIDGAILSEPEGECVAFDLPASSLPLSETGR